MDKHRRQPYLRYLTEGIVVLLLNLLLLHTMYVLLIGKPDVLPQKADTAYQYREYIGGNMAGVLFIYLFQCALNLYQVSLDKAEEAEQMRQRYAAARLQALRNQVNPHFLFNSLSVLTSLVQVNADQSARFIQQLAKAYRYILEQKDASLVSLRAELDFLNAYFFLLRIRFENKIQLDVNISVDPQQFTLPPLTLQLLVENAVKHNKMSADKPLCINICNDRELLVVQNNRNARDQVEASTGTGLQNITSRYRMISRDSVQVTASPQTFTVVIPLIKNRNK